MCGYGIEHRRTKVRSPQTNGFVERFPRTAKEECFEITLRKKLYASLEELQRDLDAWLVYYNTERPHQGYRNMGKRPIDTVNAYLEERALAEPAAGTDRHRSPGRLREGLPE